MRKSAFELTGDCPRQQGQQQDEKRFSGSNAHMQVILSLP